MRGTLTIYFHSDTCFSMPAALDATVDINVALDRLGLPIAPGKTLHGLLRDTWLSAQQALDPQNLGEALVGSAKSHGGEGLLRIGDARITDETRDWIEWAIHPKRHPKPVNPASLREAFLIERTQTAENRTLDTPQHDTLRVMRIVPAGTTLTASLTAREGFTRQHRELLELLAKLTRHVGLNRNRGLGHIEMMVQWEPQQSGTAHGLAIRKEGPNVSFLPFRLRLTAPCLITGNELDPNSQVTRPFITGAALRGALANALVRSGASQEELRELLVSGKVRFLPAYPEIAGQRAVPTPITWQRNKIAGADDWATEAEPRDMLLPLFGGDADPESGQQRQPLHSLFLAYDGSSYRPANIKTRYSTHMQRDAATGVSTKDRSTVFVYEAIESDQSFYGCIALPADRDDLRAKLLGALQAPLWLGRSARAGYGGDPIVEFLVSSRSDSNEHGESVSILPEIRANEWFAVRLTSDALLRDPDTGQHDPWQLKRTLEEVFKAKASVHTACVRAGILRGYNSLWRTDLPELPCVAAGSVALLRSIAPISRQEVVALQSQALGERTAEGLGCFVIAGQDALENLTVTSEPDDAVPEPTVTETPMVLAAQSRLYRQRLRVLLAQEAVRLAAGITRRPSPSLIQRLRAPLGDPANLAATYETWFATKGDHMLKDTARKALEHTRVEGKTLMEYLLTAVNRDWAPTLSETDLETISRTRYRLVTEASADRIWADEKRGLKIYFLDTLLSRLAKDARQAESEPTTEEGNADGNA